nr:protein-ADP-ribose hydrolase [uncultured Ruminococcus sp.]
MTHEEQRIWLIKKLQKDSNQLSHYQIPDDEQGQKNLLRALMNIWMPKPLSEEYLRIESDYLRAEAEAKGITYLSDLKPIDDDLYLWQGDITTLACDAVVNAGNAQLLGCFQILHSCIDNCLHSASGLSLRYRCWEIMREQGHEEPTGRAKITPAYNLPSKYVLHTVGPIVSGRLSKTHCEQLRSCYLSCLKLAVENGCDSIAFCCISTGVFGFPQKEAAEIAVHTVREYKKETSSDIKVIFNVFKNEDLVIYQNILQ